MIARITRANLMSMKRALIIIAAVSAVAVAACASMTGAADVSPDCVAVGMKVSPSTADLHVGDTIRVAASLPPCAVGYPVTFVWSSSDANVAVVDRSGLVTARGEGTATVTASAEQDPNVKGAAVVRVSP